MKKIALISTGGTIAGASEAKFGREYKAGVLSAEEILAKIPEIGDYAEISCTNLAQIDSKDMSDEILLNLAKTAQNLSRNFDGIVITHGTDTLEESAYFLNLCVKTEIPIIFTAAMRSADSLSSDGALNLLNAIALASDEKARNLGVLVAINDEIHAAREICKTHTTNLAAFKSPNSGKIGHIRYGKSQIYFAPLRRHTKKSDFDISEISILPKVDILYLYQGISAEILENFANSSATAVILATLGNGSLPKNIDEICQNLTQNGKIIIKSSRVLAGEVEQNAQESCVVADNLNPAKARILARLSLTKSSNLGKIQEFFNNY